MEATVSTRSVTNSEVLNLTDPGPETAVTSNTVKFKVAYPKNYSGRKYWNDGDIIETSKESAEEFEKRNLGKIVAEESKGDAKEDEDGTSSDKAEAEKPSKPKAKK